MGKLRLSSSERMQMGKVAGKVAIVTGAGRGIGRAVALKLATEGARLVVNDYDEEPALRVVHEIKELGGTAVACVGDVAAADFGERFVGTALSNFSALDIIVNNAGYTLDSVIQKMSDANFQAMLDVHVLAPFRILRAAAEPIRHFYKRESAAGREVFRKVVNVSSMSGTNGNAGQLNYSAAKAALVGMTKTLSKEWGRYKVCVNCVAFGLIETRLTSLTEESPATVMVAGHEVRGLPVTNFKALSSAIPLGRPGTPEEAAGGIYLFCIPESNYVSGQVVAVGGGVNI